MKSYICLSALALLIAVAGCAPRLAETPLGTEEKRWEDYIKKSYPAWKRPQTIPPEKIKGTIESPATDVIPAELDALPEVKKEEVVIKDVVVEDKKGKVLSDKVTAVDEKEDFKAYVVQKNDTLWSISQKLYKDGRKWKKIRDANADLLKDSNRVFPGMTLRVPLP